ncbi:hypothetical protein ALC62_00999 [Cyphomyrmex costatus]|uniref:Uncharacterized protein n=1 Tax=Cyphomyrmex costatus TaxID=456900 RepID=A0A151IPR4_9HYME|nr:hypothetical protein ALC62_00999 [Cyphomyrmex costatus]
MIFPFDNNINRSDDANISTNYNNNNNITLSCNNDVNNITASTHTTNVSEQFGKKKIIETIRKKGNFIYNTDPSVNTGQLIVCRRPSKESRKTVQHFTCCANCKGWFTKNNIRHHFKQCTNILKGDRNVQILGRAVMGRIHECASETVRKFLFPVLREDNITRSIRYDKLLITYANKLCIKYTHQQQDMIRVRLRLLGRFLIAVKEYNPKVTEFFDIYDPSVYDDCLKVVNKIANFNYITKKYSVPTIASNIGTYLKHVGSLLITECTKTSNKEKQESTENFLKIKQEDYRKMKTTKIEPIKIKTIT